MNDTPEKKDVVPSQYRDRYKSTGGTNGDFIAVALSKIGEDGLDALNAVKTENGIEKGRWSTFNPGMQRMNLANVLRGRFLTGETISILGRQYNAKHMAEDFNGKIEDNDKALDKLAGFLELAPGNQSAKPRVIAALRKLFFAPAKKTKEERDAERAAAKAATDKAKAITKAEKALTKASEARAKTAAALDTANAALDAAVKANNSAKDDDKAAATKAMNAAQKKADAAQEKDDAAAQKVEEATAALAAAKGA